jgi:hypothetical protein
MFDHGQLACTWRTSTRCGSPTHQLADVTVAWPGRVAPAPNPKRSQGVPPGLREFGLALEAMD